MSEDTFGQALWNLSSFMNFKTASTSSFVIPMFQNITALFPGFHCFHYHLRDHGPCADGINVKFQDFNKNLSE